MSHYSRMEIAKKEDFYGRRRVWGVTYQGVYVAAGWLMPGLPDSRQQPKSAAFRIVENRA